MITSHAYFRRSAHQGCINLLLLLAAIASALPSTAAAKVTAHTGEITLPTYGWAAVKHPYFRGTDGVNIYPYPMLDFLSRDKTNRSYRTVVLENEYLRITFLPELGGKIHEVLDKTTGQPMFYVNHVIKPGLIGQCGAWTSGGVEWNTGPKGHTVSCMTPVDVVILPPEKDGSRSVAIGETERIYRTKWTVVVTLRPGRSFIEERIRIYNPTETIRPYYFWNCTAVPNTPGFRFIYPMTLGCDHAGEKFFNWPIDNGKDLTRGTNYQDASSIFAWHCDQDFFGSYNDDLGRGVVAYANHHQLPGKKAWTWGQGGFGKMHQMDLTDDDGPYNEVQTGPLLTQAQVGRLDPCEAVEWKEWWYPVHGIGGFTFANREVAVSSGLEGGKLNLRMLGTADRANVKVQVFKATNIIAQANCKLSPRSPSELSLPLGGATEPLVIKLLAGEQTLANFRLPLDLPVRQQPPSKSKPEFASEFAQAGWEDFLFARFPEAESCFRDAVRKDPTCVEAGTGLAFLKLDSDPSAAAGEARAALAIDPNKGLARFVLAVSEMRAGDDSAALNDAWKAALDPATAVAARALVAKILLRRQEFDAAIAALTQNGPWQSDSECRNRLALALQACGQQSQAAAVVTKNLEVDPLDDSMRSTECFPPFWLASYEDLEVLRQAVASNPGDGRAALRLGHLLFHLGRHTEGREMWKRAAELGAEPVIAYRALGMAAKTLDNDLKSARAWLEKANQADPKDAIVARDLANVLFALADKADSDTAKRELATEVRAKLKAAFDEGKGRSDFVALLARAQNRLEEFAETARMLDSVRVTIWEGAHEVHDLFVQSHLALGEAHLKAGRAAEALAEFNRALEYPANLATGKLENAREAHIQYARGNALAALGRKQEAAAVWKLAADEPESTDARISEARQKAKEALEKLAR